MRHRSITRLFVTVAVVMFVLAQSVPAMAGTWPAGTHRVELSVSRVAGADRYVTSVAAARAGWPGWADIDRVIIASGEDRALADPLSAGSLCWAYDAPLLLVTGDSVPPVVRQALEEIVAVNPLVYITVVGGTGSVGPAVTAELAALVAPGTVEQPWVIGDRYDTAAGVALRVAEVARDTSRTVPARALLANGTTPFGFIDALSLSAVSAQTGVPVLLAERDIIPPATASTLATLPAGDVIVAGGVGAISAAVYDAVGGSDRWHGIDRYATSVAVAAGARGRGWLSGTQVGLAGSVPDALTGSIVAGRAGGPLLATRQLWLDRATVQYLADMGGAVESGVIFGGTGVVSHHQERELSGYPTGPTLYGPARGAWVGKRAVIRVGVGTNTTAVQLWYGSTLVSTKAATSYSVVDFGSVSLPADGVPLRAVAVSGDGKTSETNATYRRLSYPASTSIVIDKSDFRLYYVKNDVLIESYPIAIGRPGMETPTRLWKINSKYYTDPNGVYGPRKMRLYAQSGSSWVYTAYNIHGTNEPWVIGTKASHGCIRLYNKDILDLFPQVGLGTLVLTRQ